MTSVKSFSEISYDELMDVNGGEGFDLLEMVAVGFSTGVMAGLVTTPIGGVGAGLGAAGAYCLYHIFMSFSPNSN